MKQVRYSLTIVLVMLLLVSCGTENSGEKVSEVPEIVEVELSVNPEEGKINEPIQFEAKVTQGTEAVTDADEVVFEIWRAQDDKHEKLEVKHAEDGIYRLEKSFDQEGTYYIISHVTARDMHTMPKKEFVVGSPSEPEDPNSSDSMDMGDTDQMDENEGH